MKKPTLPVLTILLSLAACSSGSDISRHSNLQEELAKQTRSAAKRADMGDVNLARSLLTTRGFRLVHDIGCRYKVVDNNTNQTLQIKGSDSRDRPLFMCPKSRVFGSWISREPFMDDRGHVVKSELPRVLQQVRYSMKARPGG